MLKHVLVLTHWTNAKRHPEAYINLIMEVVKTNVKLHIIVDLITCAYLGE